MRKNSPNGIIGKKLVLSIFLNLLITGVQVIGGLLSGSLSLITDALHNLTDTFSLITSFIAFKLSGKRNTEEKTFGYKRAEVLAALLNASLLIIISFFLFKEAVIRLFQPVSIDSKLVIVVAFLGLAANAFCAFLLKSHSRQNMNIRSAFLHLFSDALVSLTVIVGAVFIYFFDILWIDSVLALLIGIYVIKEGYKILANSLAILMHNVPKGTKLRDVQARIENIEEVKDVHHAHLWAVTEQDIHFEAHINVSRDMQVSETCILIKKIEEALKEHFAITHVTLQVEVESCKGINLVK